jgi:branched-chain amino acid transport system substrate-binding protein
MRTLQSSSPTTFARRLPPRASLRWRWLLAGAVIIATLLLSACGGSDEEATGDGSGPKNVPGVTDTEIKLGTHFALSQTPAAAYAPIIFGMRAYFDYINDQGGVNGRKITFIIGDDHYNPSDSVEVVRKLVEQDNVFAIVAGLGEACHSAVYKYLEERGVPDLFITAGLLKWSEPVAKTRFAGSVDFVTEGRMLGKYVVENYPGKKIGLLLQNDEMGVDSEKGLNMALEGSDVTVVAKENYEAINFDATAQTQRLRNSGAEVVMAFAIPPQAASLVKTARETLNWDVPILVSGIDVSEIFIDLAGAQNTEGIVSIVMGHQIYETDQPGIKQHIEIMQKYGGGTEPSNFSLYGQAMGELTVEGLKRAGRDLTRESLVDAIESIRGWYCSGCMVPVSFSPTDHRPLEIEMYDRVENGKWVAFGDPISFESTTE